jgi:hypothetical protein
MKRSYITLQVLIAAKMNGKNNTVKQAAASNATITHYIL